MKNHLLFLLLFTLACSGLRSQIPFKTPMFGDDVVIQNIPERDQRLTSFATDINGRQFSTYAYPSRADIAVAALYSDDNGLTWDVISDAISHDYYKVKLRSVTGGGAPEEVKSFFYYSITLGGYGRFNVWFQRWNGNTLQGEDGFAPPPAVPTISYTHDAALSTDDFFPATGASPFAIGIVHSAEKYSQENSVYVATASNGGSSSFEYKEIYTVSDKYLGKVDISYARSASYPQGRYFVVWEEKDSYSSSTGHLYTAYSLTGFNSEFSTPVRLDDFLPGSDNQYSNPRIACQVSAADNGSNNLTTVILADKVSPGSDKHQIIGFYNDLSLTSNDFTPFVIGDTSNNNKQADICFNPYDSTFMVSYFDSTAKKIPYLIHNFNFSGPVEWTVVNPGINDNENISDPNPDISLCHSSHTGAVVWASDQESGNRVALYDGVSHYYSAVEEHLSNEDLSLIKIFPNPANTYFDVQVNVHNEGSMRFELYNTAGGKIRECSRVLKPGTQIVSIPVADLPDGMYLLVIHSLHSCYSRKVTIIH